MHSLIEQLSTYKGSPGWTSLATPILSSQPHSSNPRSILLDDSFPVRRTLIIPGKADSRKLADLIQYRSKRSLQAFPSNPFLGSCRDLIHSPLPHEEAPENKPLFHLCCLEDCNRIPGYYTRWHWLLHIPPRWYSAISSACSDWLHPGTQLRWRMDTHHSENCAFHCPCVNHLSQGQMQVGICHGDVLPEPRCSTVLLLSRREKVSSIVVSVFLSLGG